MDRRKVMEYGKLTRESKSTGEYELPPRGVFPKTSTPPADLKIRKRGSRRHYHGRDTSKRSTFRDLDRPDETL
jgi:hypothetical protein